MYTINVLAPSLFQISKYTTAFMAVT